MEDIKPRIEELKERQKFLKERHSKLSRFNGLLLGMSIILIIGVPLIIFAIENHRTSYVFILYALAPLVIYPTYLQRIRQYEKELNDLELDLDIEQFDIGKEISYAEKTLRLHNNQLKRYYDLNLRQNSWIFGFGIFCILLGFGIILVTFYLVLNVSEDISTKIITGSLGGISAILSNFIAALYLKMNASVSSNLKEFHQKLVETHKLLMGNLIAAKIDSQQIKESTYSDMAKSITK